jgi:lysophospholipase L1-like esterase
MSPRARAVRDYAIIVVGTLVLLELLSFAVLVWLEAGADDVSIAQAVSARLRQHPFLDREIRGVKRNDEYVFFPTTQHAFRADTAFEDLRIGRHGFILNGDDEPAHYPDKPAGLVRIVVLGGSSAAGATATGNDKTIPAQLEALLNEVDGARYQVLNFGMGGNYSYGELTRLVSEVAYLAPDVVILFDGFNDAHYANLEHARSELDAPIMNWADYSYQYFDTMAGLRGAVRAAPPVMTYAYLLVAELLGRGHQGSVREQREALYAALPGKALSDWVGARDPRYSSVLRTNLDVAAAWAARNGVGMLAYLQPHPWEHKDLACEKAKGVPLVLKRLGPGMDEARYADVMRAAFQGYAEVYRHLGAAYADAPRVRFIDLRPLFEGVGACIYNDAIHYNDDGNLRIARRMRDDLLASGFGK